MAARPEEGLNERAYEAGWQGTLLKTASMPKLLDVMRAVSAGGIAFDPRHPRTAATKTSAHRDGGPSALTRLIAATTLSREQLVDGDRILTEADLEQLDDEHAAAFARTSAPPFVA